MDSPQTPAIPPCKFILIAGIPKTPEVLKYLELRRNEGKNPLYVLTEDERKDFTATEGAQIITWRTDEEISRWLFDHTSFWLGAEVLADPMNTKIQRLSEIMGSILNLQNFDTRSMKALAKDNLPTRNSYRNFKWIEDGIPLKRTKGTAKDRKSYVVIVAAGPSLNTQWEELKRIKDRDGDRACFIVVGRSYTPLMEAGIVPDFVVECEQFEWDSAIWYFAPKPNPKTILACTLSVCPEVLRAWPGEKMALVPHEIAVLMKYEVGVDSIDGGNSVAHLAFNLANYLGADEIAFAGIDLAYPNGLKEDTHASGTFHRGWPSDILKAEHMHQEIAVAVANDGTEVRTSPPYINFATYFSLQVEKFKKANKNLKVYSFSPKGQKIMGVEYKDIKTWEPSPSSQPSLEVSISHAAASASGLSAASLSTLTAPLNTSEAQTTPTT